MKRVYYLLVFLVFSIVVAPLALAYSSPGKATAFVNDYTNTLSSNQITSLNNRLESFKQETSNEIAVAIISSLEDETIETYAIKLFEDWQIGEASKDNGVLLLIALNDRRMRIEVGYGLEGALPDAYSYQIVNKTLKPAFQTEQYYEGIDQALDNIIAATRGEYTVEATKDNIWTGELIFYLLIIFIFLLEAFWRYLAKSKAWWQGGLIGLALGLFISFVSSFSLVYFIALSLGLLIFGLVFDYLVSRVFPKPKPRKKGRGGPWFFGGGFGGSSGGGFGGFGGGSSGGGGASSSW